MYIAERLSKSLNEVLELDHEEIMLWLAYFKKQNRKN